MKTRGRIFRSMFSTIRLIFTSRCWQRLNIPVMYQMQRALWRFLKSSPDNSACSADTRSCRSPRNLKHQCRRFTGVSAFSDMNLRRVCPACLYTVSHSTVSALMLNNIAVYCSPFRETQPKNVLRVSKSNCTATRHWL